MVKVSRLEVRSGKCIEYTVIMLEARVDGKIMAEIGDAKTKRISFAVEFNPESASSIFG